jgi:hypothetical protein
MDTQIQEIHKLRFRIYTNKIQKYINEIINRISKLSYGVKVVYSIRGIKADVKKRFFTLQN